MTSEKYKLLKRVKELEETNELLGKVINELITRIPKEKPSNNLVLHQGVKSTKMGCGKKMDAIGYIICGEFDDLKHGGKQWLCDDCKSTKKGCGNKIYAGINDEYICGENDRICQWCISSTKNEPSDIHDKIKEQLK